jgi:hypothetical protein
MLFKEIVDVYSKSHTKPLNTLWGQNADLVNVAAHDSTVRRLCSLNMLSNDCFCRNKSQMGTFTTVIILTYSVALQPWRPQAAVNTVP